MTRPSPKLIECRIITQNAISLLAEATIERDEARAKPDALPEEIYATAQKFRTAEADVLRALESEVQTVIKNLTAKGGEVE